MGIPYRNNVNYTYLKDYIYWNDIHSNSADEMKLTTFWAFSQYYLL